MQLVKPGLNINFMGVRKLVFLTSILAVIATFVLVATRGLNLGIDFTGGILIEAQFKETPDIAKMRESLKETGLGDVSLQTFGADNNILIRIGQEAAEESERVKIVDMVKATLAKDFPGEIDYRKVDYVGPKVGGELIKGGAWALVLSFAAMMVYIWFRFEWQYGVGGILALVHDAIVTIGFFSITQLEFNLSSIAAVLTITGYSINDSVVIYDRIRENLRKFKTMPMNELLNISINETLSRTILTGGTTIVAIIALILLGGEVIRSFSLAMFFGVIIGTYSSIYISAPLLIYLNLRREEKNS